MLPFLRFSKEKRVRVIVVSSDNHVLLVRNWFGYQNWSLPGGGIKKNETPRRAAIRELYEETGMSLKSNGISYIKPYICHESFLSFKSDVYYTATKKRSPLTQKRDFEILEIKWHSIKKLPKNLAIPIKQILKEAKDI